jgi:predicted dehydrogenase
MTKSMVERIVIFGAGSIGKKHLEVIRNILPNVEVKFFKHQEQNRLDDFANDNLHSVDEVLKFSPQIAVIANPAPFHIKFAQILAEAGINLLIEKPLSNLIDGIVQLIETCEKNKNVLMVGYNLRFSPSLQQFRKYVSEEIVGEIFSIHCEVGRFLPDWRPGTDYRSGVSARKELGGGVLLELSHEIDYLNWIFGDIDWTIATLTKQSDLEIDVEDTAHLILGFSPKQNGREIISVVTLDFIRHDQTRVCTVIGEAGTLRWDGLKGKVEIFTRATGIWKQLYLHEPKLDETYLAEWKNFLECISNGKTPLVSGVDGLRVVEIIGAAKQSSENGMKTFVKYESIKNGRSQ